MILLVKSSPDFGIVVFLCELICSGPFSLLVSVTEENEQCLKEILDAIENDLTPQAGRILYLRYGEGKSYRETAEILGISISAVNKHVVKALKKLRTKFLKNNEL